MKSVLRLVLLGGLLLASFAAPASAQYMFLDTNGDGLRTEADVMNPNGTPTTVSVYLVTNANRDGSPATCSTGEALTINSYVLNLSSSGGTVDFGDFTNSISAFTIPVQPLLESTTELTVGYGSGTPLDPGKYLLGTFTVTGTTGAPSLSIIPIGTLQPVNLTSFGSLCAGSEGDNTLKLGTDWTDADGLPAAAGGNSGPEISAPPTATATEGVEITPILVTATDADPSDVLTITQTGAPASLTLTTTPGASPVTATLTGTPSFADQGSYAILWSVNDGSNPPDTMTTVLTIANVDRAPTVTSPVSTAATVGNELTFVVTANDPDDDFILALAAAPLPEGATFVANATNTSGTFTWTPTAAQTGVFNLTFTANNSQSGSSGTEIIVTGGGDSPPTISTIPDVSVAENGTISVPVNVTDADNDEITLTANLPAFAVLNAPTSGTGSIATSITVSPGVGTSGTYEATVTATANGVAVVDSFQIVVGGADQAPVVTAPLNISENEGSLITFTVSVTDPNGDAITSLTATPLPEGASFTPNAGNTSGTFSWAPSASQAGSYSITFTASNTLTGTTTTLVTVANVDVPPTLVPISDVTVQEGNTETINILARDLDGELITITTSTLPSFATLNPPTSGTDSVLTTITLAPGAGDAGTYNITVTATAGEGTITEAFVINVIGDGVDQAPTVTAPATITGAENTLVTFTVTANDPDGDAITTLTASPLPTGATFVANASNTSGTFTWTPTGDQSGPYSITFTASNALSGSATTAVTITDEAEDQPVTIAAIGDVTVAEGGTITVNVSATDPDGDAITLSSSLPPFATLNAPTSGTGTVNTTITISPTTGDEGTYTASVTATANGTTDTETFTITVTAGGGNQCPAINVSATQNVNEGQLLTFTVSATDPDGDDVALSAAGLPAGASFTDNNNNTATFSWTPGFTQSGTYTVTFSGNDANGCTQTATTTITVNDVTGGAVQALVFVSGGNQTTRLRSGKPFTCVQIEPVNSSFSIEDVILTSVTMSYQGTTIDAMPEKTQLNGDTNHNGVREVKACFSKEDLRSLFGDLDPGENLVGVTVRGTLSTGGTFEATFNHTVIVAGNNGGGQDKPKPRARPNPLNPKTDLYFTLAQAGRVRIAIYDAQGRLVKNLLDDSRSAGDHIVPWDGSDARGAKVSSGVYFFRIQSKDSNEVVRVTVLK